MEETVEIITTLVNAVTMREFNTNVVQGLGLVTLQPEVSIDTGSEGMASFPWC